MDINIKIEKSLLGFNRVTLTRVRRMTKTEMARSKQPGYVAVRQEVEVTFLNDPQTEVRLTLLTEEEA